MPFRPIPYRRLTFACLGLVLGGYLLMPTLALARSIFSPPSGRGLPGRRIAAGTRSECLPLDKINPRSADVSPKNQRKIEALVPVQTVEQTVSDYPTFFWYLPKNTLSAVEFTLVASGSSQPIHRTLIPVNGRSGVMRYQLPSQGTVPPLNLNTVYRWTVRGICSGDGLPTQVGGQLKRVAPSPTLTAALQQASAAQRPDVFGAAGLWYDMVASLAELRQARPRDTRLARTWTQLMQEIELEYMARDPLVP